MDSEPRRDERMERWGTKGQTGVNAGVAVDAPMESPLRSLGVKPAREALRLDARLLDASR